MRVMGRSCAESCVRKLPSPEHLVNGGGKRMKRDVHALREAAVCYKYITVWAYNGACNNPFYFSNRLAA